MVLHDNAMRRAHALIDHLKAIFGTICDGVSSDCMPILLEGKRKLVIADSLFSMDGDYADLHGLVALKARHNFALMLDEAHATLVCGERCTQLASYLYRVIG